MLNREIIDNWFTYHTPKSEYQIQQYQNIREAGKHFALTLLHNCPPESLELLHAILRVREAVMIANAAIACAKGAEKEV